MGFKPGGGSRKIYICILGIKLSKTSKSIIYASCVK